MATSSNESQIKYLENYVRQYQNYITRKRNEMQNCTIRLDELIQVKYAQKTYEQLTKQLDYLYRKDRKVVFKLNNPVQRHWDNNPVHTVPSSPNYSYKGIASSANIGYEFNSNATPFISTNCEQPPTFKFPDMYLYKLFGTHRCNHGISCPGFLNAKYCAPLSGSFGDD